MCLGEMVYRVQLCEVSLNKSEKMNGHFRVSFTPVSFSTAAGLMFTVFRVFPRAANSAFYTSEPSISRFKHRDLPVSPHVFLVAFDKNPALPLRHCTTQDVHKRDRFSDMSYTVNLDITR